MKVSIAKRERPRVTSRDGTRAAGPRVAPRAWLLAVPPSHPATLLAPPVGRTAWTAPGPGPEPAISQLFADAVSAAEVRGSWSRRESSRFRRPTSSLSPGRPPSAGPFESNPSG